MDSCSPIEARERDVVEAGFDQGMDAAIGMMRGGRLRLTPLPWDDEREYPYTLPFRPVKATWLIWREWWRDRHGR